MKLNGENCFAYLVRRNRFSQNLSFRQMPGLCFNKTKRTGAVLIHS